MMRPEARETLWRLREVGVSVAIAAFGGWLIYLGGYLLTPVGALVIAGAAVMAIQALRRMRFAQPINAPGVVEIDEGEISYMGPQIGGAVSLVDLVELRLISLRGRRLWRLKQADGQAILIPLEAAGSEALFDAFCSLPGLSSGALMAALQPVAGAESHAIQLGGENRVVWRRAGPGVVAHGHTG